MLENLINEIVEIIKDYRNDEGIQIDSDHINTWINQFDENDRIFILTELLPILRNRYISKSIALSKMKDIVEELTVDFGYNSPEDFIKDCFFLDLQSEGKSQKKILEFFNDFIDSEFNININEFDNPKKIGLYLDDFLCTGDTLYKNLKNWFEEVNSDGKPNIENIKNSSLSLIFVYFVIHDYHLLKTKQRIYQSIDKEIGSMFSFYYFVDIEDYRIERDKKMDFIYPLDNSDPLIINCQAEIEALTSKGYPDKESHYFRPNNCPQTETLFTSTENRIRFENILLKKGIEIFNYAGTNRN